MTLAKLNFTQSGVCVVCAAGAVARSSLNCYLSVECAAKEVVRSSLNCTHSVECAASTVL